MHLLFWVLFVRLAPHIFKMQLRRTGFKFSGSRCLFSSSKGFKNLTFQFEFQTCVYTCNSEVILAGGKLNCKQFSSD